MGHDASPESAATSGTRLICIVVALVVFGSAMPLMATDAPFVSRTHVIAPRHVGDFILEGTSYDQANRFAGLGIRYTLADHPETRFDLFVYPAGRMSPEQAIAAGMVPFRESLKYGAQNGYFADLRITEDSPVMIPSEPGKDGDDPLAAPTIDGNDPLPADLRTLLGDTRIRGQRLQLSYAHKPSDLPMRSRGYLFYRQLYYFKGRISAAESRIDEASFSALAERAMRELVPAVSALNVGACADITVFVPKDDDSEEDRNATQRSLVTGLANARGANCTGEPATEALAERGRDAEVVTIEFEPGDWSGK